MDRKFGIKCQRKKEISQNCNELRFGWTYSILSTQIVLTVLSYSLFSFLFLFPHLFQSFTPTVPLHLCGVSPLIPILSGVFLTNTHQISITQHSCHSDIKCDFCDKDEPVDHLSVWGRNYFLTVLLQPVKDGHVYIKLGLIKQLPYNLGIMFLVQGY